MQLIPKKPVNREITIGLREVLGSLWGSMPAIILSVAIGSMIAFLGTVFFTKPLYSSTTKLYVMADNEQDKLGTSVDNQTLQAGALLTKDYEQIIESPEVTESVITNLNLKSENGVPMSNGELTGKITVLVPDDTRIVEIKVTDDDPYRACDIANEIREESEERIQTLMNIKTVKTVSKASIPMGPQNMNISHNVFIGGILGVIIAIDIVIIGFATNNKIRSEEDIQDYLGTSVLASIPKSENLGKNNLRKRMKRSKHHERNRN